MFGVKALYLIWFLVSFYRPDVKIYRSILLAQSIVEALIEFGVYSLFFADYMESLDDSVSSDAHKLSLFASTYLIFCLPYKAFSIMALYLYSDFDCESEDADLDPDFFSKLQ